MDDSFIVTSGWDKSATLWTSEGSLVTRLEGHSAGISSVLLTPDNQLAATASDDGTVKIWDAASSRVLWSIDTDGSAAAESVELTRDGQFLLAATGKTAKVWRIDRDNRPAAELSEIRRCRVGYVLEQGSLQRDERDREECVQR